MSTPPNLPAPVQRYLDATNAHDLEGLAACFRADAVVNDHRDEFVGADRIRAWAADEIIGARVTMAPTAVRRIGDHTTVTARIDGTYDKTGLPDPLILAFYFTVSGDQLAALIIVHNKPAAA